MSTAIVIGGASGIGWASARALAAEGFSNFGLIVDMAVAQFRSVVDVWLTAALILASTRATTSSTADRWCRSRRSMLANRPSARAPTARRGPACPC